MNKTLKMVMTLCLTLSLMTAQAQSDTFFKSEEDTPSKEKSAVLDRLWFGTGLDGLGISSNSFGFGLSPIIGYKLTKELSAGIRIPFNYQYDKYFNPNTGENINYSRVDLGIGGFTRAKILWGIFAHAEYNQLWENQPIIGAGGLVIDPEDSTKILSEVVNRDEFNVGLGYSSGNRVAYEISVLYNVLEPNDSSILPFTIRAGFNYNF